MGLAALPVHGSLQCSHPLAAGAARFAQHAPLGRFVLSAALLESWCWTPSDGIGGSANSRIAAVQSPARRGCGSLCTACALGAICLVRDQVMGLAALPIHGSLQCSHPARRGAARFAQPAPLGRLKDYAEEH